MFTLLYFFSAKIAPFVPPLCFILAWVIIILLFWNLWITIVSILRNAKRMHSIPCAHCQYFTGDYRLKCTAQPYIALSDQAIGCSDYRSITSIWHNPDN